MKKTFYTLPILFCLSLFFSFSPARTAKTLCNGSYETPLIWSDSTLPGPGDTILIEHLVRNSDTLRFDNNTLIISALGELCSNEPFYLSPGSRCFNYGILGADKFFLEDTLINYDTLQCNFLSVSGYLVVAPNGFLRVGSYSCFQFPDCTPVILAPRTDSLYSNEAGIDYEWTLNGSPLAVNTRDITPTGFGDYRVRVRQADSSFTPYSPPYSYLAASVDPAAVSAGFAVYPNPSTGKIFVNWEAFSGNPASLQVVNLMGQVMRTGTLNAAEQLLDLSELSAGTYLLRISPQQGTPFSQRVVIRP